MSTLAKKKSRIQEGNPIATVAIYAICIFLGLICVYPMYYVLCMSLSSTFAVEARKVFFYPIDMTFQAYKVIFLKDDLWRAYGNTIIYLRLSQNLGIYYTVSVKDYPIAVILNVGDRVSLEYVPVKNSPLLEVVTLEVK